MSLITPLARLFSTAVASSTICPELVMFSAPLLFQTRPRSVGEPLTVVVPAVLNAPLPVMAPPLRLSAPFTVRSPAPESVPPVMFKLLTVEALPRLSAPPDIEAVPVDPAMSVPPSVNAPEPDTATPPPRLVTPDTVNEPPDTLSELPLLMVNAVIVSVPVEWLTASPLLMSAVSSKPGRAPALQLPGVAQSRLPLALVKVSVLPPE